MGKEYNKIYRLAGENAKVGTMICSVCKQPINSEVEDWVYSQKTKRKDWFYVVKHRRCVQDQRGWEALEIKQKEYEDNVTAIISFLSQYKDADGSFSGELYSALEQLKVVL